MNQMKWAQLSHFAEFSGMQLELVKISLSQLLKNTPADEITCLLANHYSIKLLCATVKITSEIKDSGCKSLNIESFQAIPHLVYFNKTCVKGQ